MSNYNGRFAIGALDAVLTIITLNKPFPFTMVALGGRCTI
jgi:hypothetical protein